jgi:hypothetical protein
VGFFVINQGFNMSLISKTASVDSLVAEMSAALEDKDFRSVFERPVIRTASDESLEKKASREVTPEILLETLLATSAHLDELGFDKSAERALSVAQTLVSEAMEKANDEDDDNGANNKPKTMDVKPGEGKGQAGLGGADAKALGPGGKGKKDLAKADDEAVSKAKKKLKEMGFDEIHRVTKKGKGLEISVTPQSGIKMEDAEKKLEKACGCPVKLMGGSKSSRPF